MFKVIAKIYSGRTLVKYEVLNLSTNRKIIMSVEQVQGMAMAGSIVNAAFNEKTCTLVGINGYDLRKLSKRYENVSDRASDKNIAVLVGKRLINTVNKSTHGFKERHIISELDKFIQETCKGKICALYGLRRTGKTVLMYQSIGHLIKQGERRVAYITLTENDSISNLFKTLDQLVDKKIEYIFIDEITSVKGFIQSSALLADKYANMGIHIVIAGTESYAIELASHNNLYNRVIKISTTYIGFKEFEYLNPGTSILDYIHIGGVLPADIFYNEADTNMYINTAISNNIINSLVKANNRKEHQRLLELEHRGLLKKAIEQAIASSNQELTASVIADTYINGDLGSAKQMLASVFDIDSTLDTEDIENRVRYKLSIVKEFDTDISSEYVEELKEYLVDIGVIKMYTRYVGIKKVTVPLFMQPGLRYNQTVALINALCESESFFNMPKKVRDMLRDKIISDVEGNLIEHEVLISNLLKYENSTTEVTQVNYKGKEIDMVVRGPKKTGIYKVKRSNNVVPVQFRWLIDADMRKLITKLFGADADKIVVLYLGNNTVYNEGTDTILYINVEQFLKFI